MSNFSKKANPVTSSVFVIERDAFGIQAMEWATIQSWGVDSFVVTFDNEEDAVRGHRRTYTFAVDGTFLSTTGSGTARGIGRKMTVVKNDESSRDLMISHNALKRQARRAAQLLEDVIRASDKLCDEGTACRDVAKLQAVLNAIAALAN